MNKNIQDFLGNELQIGDKIISVVARHLRNGIIEDLTLTPGRTTVEGFIVGDVKVKGLKRTVGSNLVIKNFSELDKIKASIRKEIKTS